MDKKNLAYRFAELPFVIQTSILTKYKLISEEMRNRRYIEFIDKIIEKAEQLGCVDKFENEVDRHHEKLRRYENGANSRMQGF